MVTDLQRKCDQCGGPRPSGSRRFCSRSCGQKYNRTEREELTLLNTIAGPIADSPLDYHQYIATNWPELIADGNNTRAHAALACKVDKSQITRWQKTWEREVVAARNLMPVDTEDPETLAPKWFQRRLYETEPLTDTELDILVDAFIGFRDLCFRTDRGAKFITKPFHARWIRQLLITISEGSRAVILSPPRHGKTELLVHFCVWLIIMNPNIRIMWIGGNSDIAKLSLGAVKEHLQFNHVLRRNFLPEGQDWVPMRNTGKNWASDTFTVGNRTITGIRSTTMTALGRRGKVLSRDADLIIGDDIEDQMSTQLPREREQTRMWGITQLSSRKEPHTGVVWIGSRQHEDDLYHHLLGIDTYTRIVEEAHDQMCELPEDAGDDVHTDCVLFPEKNPYSWLMEKRNEAEVMGQPHLFQMVYLNRVIGTGVTVFTRPIVAACHNPDRSMRDYPRDYSLIAGLDPAHTGYQAAFLWAVKFNESGEPHLVMVDIDNSPGGGAGKALNQIRNWYDEYKCHEWVIEENLLHGGVRKDPLIMDYCALKGIALHRHRTGREKMDNKYGVTSMVNMMIAGQIELPTGDPDSQHKVRVYTRQLLDFGAKANTAYGLKHVTSDLVMASWFPIPRIKALADEIYEMTHQDHSSMFDDVQWTEMPDSPWGS